MLGLAVLFFLGLWVLITLFAMWIGYKLFKKLWQKFYFGLLGAFLGFMLTMGGLIVYWTIEYIQIQRTVTHLCETEGGIKVYSSPKDFAKRLKNNNWEGLPKYTVLPKGDIENEEYILFGGKAFNGFKASTSVPQINIYNYKKHKNKISSIYDIELYTYNKEGVVLIKYVSMKTGAGNIANNLHGLKFWMNDIKDCKRNYKITGNNFSLYKQELKNE